MKTASQRIENLDALRGIAALAVLFFHYTARYDALYDHKIPVVPFYQGSYGVELFFIISGFVILMTLERTKRCQDFLIARFARLYPAFWVSMILTFTVVSFAGLPGREVDGLTALGNLTMLPEVFKLQPVDGVYWTLQVEFFFYVIMAALFIFRLHTHVAFVLLPIVLLNILNDTTGLLKNSPDLLYYLKTFLILKHAHLFLIGIILYQMRSALKSWQWGVIAICLLDTWTGGSLGNLIMVSGIAGIAFMATRKTPSFSLGHPVLLFLGAISYPLYLIHSNIGYILIRYGEFSGSPYLWIGIATVVSILLATGITFYVERPANRFIRAWYQRQNTVRMYPEGEKSAEFSS